MLGLIPLLKKPKLFGRWDSYALVITDQRTIFAQLTANMLKEAAMEAQKTGKEEGKNFFARWADQLKATLAYSNRYWEITPEAALNENPGNFAIPNQDIKQIKIKRKTQSNWGDDVDQIIAEVRIEATTKKENYTVDTYSKEMVDMLKGVFGDRVKT